jgi:hypothetical protein
MSELLVQHDINKKLSFIKRSAIRHCFMNSLRWVQQIGHFGPHEVLTGPDVNLLKIIKKYFFYISME